MRALAPRPLSPPALALLLGVGCAWNAEKDDDEPPIPFGGGVGGEGGGGGVDGTDGTDGTDGADGADGGDGAGDGGDGGGGPEGPGSCVWATYGLCIDYSGYVNGGEWCVETSESFGIPYEFLPEAGCAPGIGVCAVETGGDFPAPAEVVVYEDFAGNPEDYCESLNGAWSGG
jgi:hypothetical protein